MSRVNISTLTGQTGTFHLGLHKLMAINRRSSSNMYEKLKNDFEMMGEVLVRGTLERCRQDSDSASVVFHDEVIVVDFGTVIEKTVVLALWSGAFERSGFVLRAIIFVRFSLGI